MSHYNIDSADGNSLSQGIQLEVEARRIAQRTANRLGESVYLYEVGNGDGESEAESEEIEPQPVTDSQLSKLSNEASEAGDLEQVAICERALAGDAEAHVECAKVIRNAQAQG